MGPVRSILSAVPLLLATPVFAQQDNAAQPVFNLPGSRPAPAADPRQQGPELDVFRAPAQPVIAPPTVAPTVAPTPAPVATPRVQPSTPTRPAEPRPRTPDAVPSRAQPAPPASRPAPTQPESARPDDAATATPSAPTPRLQPESRPATPPPAETAPPAETPAAAPVTPAPASSWPWITGGLLAIAAIAAFWLLRRRQPVADTADDVATAPAAPPAAPPLLTPRTPPPPTPASPALPAPPAAPDPAPTAPPPARPATAERPWIDMDLEVQGARYSMMGVTIGYVLHLHNRGDRPALDIMVRGLLGNAGGEQQALLQHFFGGESGMPLHSTEEIAPGGHQRLTGELRLSPDQIVPVELGARALLIPLAAFDAHYRWAQDDDQGSGRTARAFIVGQEQEPPVPRLAPFRLDQGPRQYRRPAARAAGELTPA